MRITNNMLINNMMNNISNNLVRMDKYQDQMSTGKKIRVPSDDPVVAARALKLRTDVSEVEQYKRNIKDAQSWLDITETALGSLGDVLQRARELAVEGANGTNTPEDTQKIAAEAKQLKDQLIHIANTAYAGRYIFSGFKTDQKGIVDTPEDTNYGLFGIDIGNGKNINYEIGIGDSITVNVLGGDLFNGGNQAVAGSEGKMIQTFSKFIAFLEVGDTGGISGLLSEFDTDMNNLLRVRADVGARQNRLELTANRLDSDTINFTKLMSENEDADVAETIMNLQNEENVYRASLAAGARIIQPTLVDFLR